MGPLLLFIVTISGLYIGEPSFPHTDNIKNEAIKNEYVRHQKEMYEFEAHANSIALENEKLKLEKIEQHLSDLESK